MKRKGYVSLEIIILCAVLLTAGIGGTVTYITKGQEKQDHVVLMTEQTYEAALNPNHNSTNNTNNTNEMYDIEYVLNGGSHL